MQPKDSTELFQLRVCPPLNMIFFSRILSGEPTISHAHKTARISRQFPWTNKARRPWTGR